MRRVRLFLFSVLLLTPSGAGAFSLDVETGYVFTSLNDSRSPNTTGSLVRLARDLKTRPVPFYRLQWGVRLGQRHALRGLYAPLETHARGTLTHDVTYEGTLFPAGTPVFAYYRFDSYRLTYRYSFVRRAGLEMMGGLTTKIRDAETSLNGGGRAVKTNTGFVPLFHLSLDWKPKAGKTGLLIDLDAAAAKQGRAEDLLVALAHAPREGVKWRVGYRMLEGGADVEEVYSFAWLHYAVVGLKVDL